MYLLAFIAVLLSGEVSCNESRHYQVVAVIPHGRAPPLVDLTDPAQAPHQAHDDLSASSSQYYPSYEDYRYKRESDELHPDAYLKPPSEDASTPLWQDGNNWDLGYDPSEILSPPMPLALGIPYDTIKLSSEEAVIPDVNEAQSSTPHRQETRPNKPRQQHKPRPYKKRPLQSISGGRYSDYDDRPISKRPTRYSDYDDAPSRPSKRQSFRGQSYQDSYSDYEDTSRPPQQASFSFSQTDQNGHYKWGVRHHH